MIRQRGMSSLLMVLLLLTLGSLLLEGLNLTRFSVQRQVTPGFAPELSVTLAARSARTDGPESEVEQRVTGYNL
ncbi:hypothetical protein G7B13_05870 [Klebsiella pneumoniae]|nr:hypothetical protein [Klebsiella pneumoniae]